MSWMVIRVRGGIHANRDIVETLDHLHLTRPNHATVLPERPEMRGMITRIEGYVTWGEAEAETIGMLLKERGRQPQSGGKPLPPETVAALAPTVAKDGLLGSEAVAPLFRLHPPTGGWRSTKRPFASGGALGYRGRAINELARRMV